LFRAKVLAFVSVGLLPFPFVINLAKQNLHKKFVRCPGTSISENYGKKNLQNMTSSANACVG